MVPPLRPSPWQRALRWSMLALTLMAGAAANAEITRADLIKTPLGVVFNKARISEWQPLVTEFGAKVMSEWERGLYEGAIGNHDQARQWLLKAATKGNTPTSDTLCLAYKLARGTDPGNRDDLYGEMMKYEAAKNQIIDWYRSAAAKRAKKQKLSPEEKAAFAGIESLPDDGAESNKVSYLRLVMCRNLTGWLSPEKLFRTAIAAGRHVPTYALNYLGTNAEEEGRLDEAAKLYAKAAATGFGPARTNQIRLQERMTAPAPGDRAWEPLLVGYRQQAELGDGSAMIYQADLMERGSSGPVNVDIATMLYMRGIDAESQKVKDFNDGMSYVFLVMYAQDRLTEHYQAGRLKLDSEEDRKKYLSMGFNLKEYLETRKEAAPKQNTQ